MILPENFDGISKNGGHCVLSCENKGSIWWQTNAEKGGSWQVHHMYTRQWGAPRI